MRKLVAGINMTLDGYCDHTAITPDEEIHDHYSKLLSNSGVILFGRITYQLMESSWPALVKNPSGNKSMDEFATTIDKIPKIVFSHTMKNVDWDTAKLAKEDLVEEVTKLRQQNGKDILVGSRSLIISLLNMNLVDELQLCIHPVILGNGMTPLLVNINDKINLKLATTKTFSSGAILNSYVF
jgi:dihydrofolate reductase